ncbi:peptidylprolyl isomerase [Polaribacter glomeratus]|uniref:Peptidylprolyl isomerase n=1 Tax=Polaribacter glomeratus TaxID=102 RepID=A0A2S7WZU9_9FLAO|nr:peptidylprolyl isomerase [Polaribacter glomeratus]PQJ82941.1 peptidylprolyl isomerase [Polaribacter glomeratus]TXD64666.1 peptidylprolyl isomerase [Polaribacter glomeratus]
MRKLVLLVVLGFSSIVFAQKKSKVLLTIDGEKITISDFKRVYEKNLDAIDNEEAKDVEKNLDLFINYKLKVKEAYGINLDTLTSYVREMETYRNQLSAPYMQDSAFINKLVKDAYFRTKNEVKAKHILIITPKTPSPKDTLEAYQKIVKIRDRIIKGEDFEEVAIEVSEDPSTRDDQKSGKPGNRGNLGYFSAFRMVYPFEAAAYNTKVGEVSEPFRTSFGYHILKVDSLRQSKGEVEVAHILITDTSTNGEALANEVYKKLQSDEQFGALARQYSGDVGTKSKGGKLRQFGPGMMVKPFEDAAYSLQKEGEYSKPFQTRFGWHIVQLIKKHPIAPFSEMESDLKSKVRSGDRAQLSQKAVINKLKKKYAIVENEQAKDIFNRTDLKSISKDSLQSIILSINDLKITQEQFVNYLNKSTDIPVYQSFEDFKDSEILSYYKDNLEKSEPEFAYTIQEYKDGLLLFELMQQKIWEKSSKDSLGLKTFFNDHIKEYQPKVLDSIKGQVMNDYQNFLEKNWISDLRRKSVIDVDKRQLKKLIKFYKSN